MNGGRRGRRRMARYGDEVASLAGALREHDPEQVPVALAAYRCFEPFAEDPQLYARATRAAGPFPADRLVSVPAGSSGSAGRFVSAGCEDEVVSLLVRLRERAAGEAGEFAAWQNAEVVAGAERYYRAVFVFPPGDGPAPLTEELAHRAIGVVYRPERERWGNYVPTVLGERYDAFLWFDGTRAVRRLHGVMADIHEPETYPSGL